MELQPIIIIGMHRSGTTMLSKILEDLGIFMGWKKEENNEALFFLKFNDWILKQAQATWDNPYNYRLAGQDFKNLMSDLARKYIKSIKRMEYLGLKKIWVYKNLEDLDFPWGWKDPRNTFTLDIWLKIFPNAKLVHIYRNPIDVAESLRKRTIKYKKNFKWNFKKQLKLLFVRGYIGYGNSVRVENIFEGIKLWKEYVSRAFEMEKKYRLNILHVKYENFLDKPFENIREILNKIGIKCGETEIREAIKNINPQRKYAFLSNKDLLEIYKKVKTDELLVRLSYDKLLV